MKRFALLILALAIAIPASAGVEIGGYIDVGYFAIQSDNQGTFQATGSTNGQANANDQFSLNEVNLDISSELTDNISVFGSFDSVRGAALAPDYAYVEFANPGSIDMNLRAGLVPSVIGIEQRESESNQIDLVNLSLLSSFTVGSSEGVEVYGAFSPVNWAISLTNEDMQGTAGNVFGAGPIAATNNNVNLNDGDNSRVIAGRLGVVPIEGLEIGVSGSMGTYIANGAANANNRDRTFLGVDAQYVYGPFRILGEYLDGAEEQASGTNDNDLKGWRVLGSYDISDALTLALQWSAVEMEAGVATGTANPVDPNDDYTSLQIGLSYDLAENVTLKGEYAINDEDSTGGVLRSTDEPDNDVFSVSLVASF